MSASIQVLTRAIQLLEILPRKDAPMCLAEIAEASGLPKSSAYPVSKAGLIMFTKCLAVEYAAEGIRANAFCPGDPYGTPAKPLPKAARPRKPCGGPLPPSRSDASAYMTGQALNVTGGQITEL